MPVLAALLVSPAVLAQAGEEPGEAPAVPPRENLCHVLSKAPWPRSAVERRQALQKLEAVRETCKDHAHFLATLGGLWLDEREPEQALLWLERSLLLDPAQLGAQADHALALAALGDRTARDELLRSWARRSDVPPLVLARLQAADDPTGARRAAADAPHRWAQFREVTVLLGGESNLDHSPRLTELTITPPEGPIDLELVQPLKPRSGAAVFGDGAWQLAYSPSNGTIVHVGVQGTARLAPSHSDTDWHNLQAATSVTQRFGNWRAKAQASHSWFGGSLDDPYRMRRWGVSLERTGPECSGRFALDAEARLQDVDLLSDSRTVGGTLSAQCLNPWSPTWTVGFAVRAAVDRPKDLDRPGGPQRQVSLGLRAQGPLGAGWRLDSTLRVTRALDDTGYSPLLANNARRWLRPIQLNVELARPVSGGLLPDSEAVVQLQALRQSSNLAIFGYTSVALFSGLRWRW